MKILIIGANSAIARATARSYAQQGHEFFLIARNENRLAELKTDLEVRGADSVAIMVLDLEKHTQHEAAIDTAVDTLGSLDIVLICHGDLPDQEKAEIDFKSASKAININGLSVISLLTILGPRLQAQEQGTIAVITSVAGDRGRQPNYIYGAAKSMVSTYIQGMRGRLYPHNVKIIDIRPGLVDSPMTAQFDKGLLWSSPERIASRIIKTIAKGKHTVYAPGYWRLIMLIVCAIPEFLFKRMKF